MLRTSSKLNRGDQIEADVSFPLKKADLEQVSKN